MCSTVFQYPSEQQGLGAGYSLKFEAAGGWVDLEDGSGFLGQHVLDCGMSES